ncbi:MAG: ACT domain-containing protein, partial [Burkholderiaceae bacterium]
MTTSQILTLQCKDRPGIVSAVSTSLYEHNANITEAQQFNDPDTGDFFMRIAFDIDSDTACTLAGPLGAIATHFNMAWKLRPEHAKKKVLILVSRLDHCYRDLLHRMHTGELNM